MSYEQSLLIFINNIKTNNVPLPKMQISTFGDLFITVCYDENDSNVMSNEATTGMDYDSSLSALKAIAEYFERKTLLYGYRRKDPICWNKYSDGVASFPIHESEYNQKARENALNEAIERYAWATWWDDINISYEFKELALSEEYLNSKIPNKIDTLIKNLGEFVQIENVYLVSPAIENSDKKVLILLLKIKSGGYISGGSCENKDSTDKALIRAMSELIRHTLGYNRFLTKHLKPESFYEKRLDYFAGREGGLIVDERLSQKGNSKIQLPTLVIDYSIASNYDQFVYTHRCLFEKQPPFVDGKLERFCL